jgi:serine/threonine protein kinase/tetratricopeptide (TPR) repeat protein
VLSFGTRLARYEIRSHLGTGGMGDVYLARDTRLDRNVALKILPELVAADPDRMRRFEQEAKAASSLNHPNIITIYEIDRSGSTSFIAMEFIEGSTLRERLRKGPMPLEEVVTVAIQVAGALAAAHADGIVHRDIKPDNVILRSDGIAKVLDFGLAKLAGVESPGSVDGEAPTRADLRTDSGVVMGTATYMSPEQARGQQIDARTDIFSLGVVLYELLTAHLPFEGSGIYEIMAATLSDREAPPLSRYASGIPAELERIVGKALRKKRDERYQTVKDLLLDLQSLRQRLEFEKAYPTPRTGAVDTAVTDRRGPRRTLIGVAAGLLVLVGGAIGYAWWRQAHSPTAIRSLAVLPLKSLDAGDNYLGLGIADAEIRRVSQTGRVIVRPTSAVRRYLTEDTDALAAAKQLGVDSVLEGSFQRANDRLRVSVNLLRCNDGASLWSDSFDIQMADIFTVQDTVAQKVASGLRLQLDASQEAQLTKRYTSNPVAYELYLKGAYNFDQRIRNPALMLDNSISFFKKAIEADPDFALAHAQLAYAYATRGVFLEPTQPAWVERAREELDRAQELDPQLADTHLVRFQLLYSQFEGYQGEAAAREALMANRLNPNVGHWELAYMYNHLGLEDLARRELERGLEIDPTSESLREAKLLIYEVQSRYDDYAADASVGHPPRVEAMYLMFKGRLDDAQKVVDDWSTKTTGNQAEWRPTMALLLAAKGEFQAAEAQIPIILAAHPRKDPLYHHAAYDIACIYALEGKSADAVKWLKESAVSGYHLYPRYTRDTFLDRIRQSPEFIQFLAEMKAENDRYRREFG